MNDNLVCNTGTLSRRAFVGAAATAAACSGASIAFASESDQETAATWMPASWEAEADIVVVGAGGAGLSAGIAALHESLGSVIVLDAAPEGETGGNTRASGQLMFIPDTPEDAIAYQTSLNGPYEVDADLMQAWAENLCENKPWLEGLGLTLEEAISCNPEFPELEGSEHCHTWLADNITGEGHLWELLQGIADDLGVEIICNARVTDLVFDPQTKEVFGVTTADGRSFAAHKGVVLACGGFQNNPELINTYYANGYPDLLPAGTPYNMGDGLVMAQSVGANLWHMNNYSLAQLGVKVCKDIPCVSFPNLTSKDYIYVGPNAKRFTYEETTTLSKHGKMQRDGVYVTQHIPMPHYAIFGKTAFEAGPIFPNYPYIWANILGKLDGVENQDFVDGGYIVKADTVAELAEQIGLDATELENTINTYNQYCEDGVDPDFGRGEDYYGNFAGMVGGSGESSGEEQVVISGFDLVKIEPPYYAMRQYISILNTQGGPKRGTKGEVLDTKGNPIPRLYAAGELGCIYPYMYNGGGNVSEAISSGRLAARSISALDAWE